MLQIGRVLALKVKNACGNRHFRIGSRKFSALVKEILSGGLSGSMNLY